MTKSSILLTIPEYETSAEPVSVLIQSIEESEIDVFETLIIIVNGWIIESGIIIIDYLR